MAETLIFPALIAATGAFIGIFATQGLTALVKRNDERRLLDGRLATLRAAVRAEITQLIDVVKGEIEFAETANWTWLPVRDYFDAFRRGQDILGMLDNEEVELLTATMHIVEERMGYIYRRAQEASEDRKSADVLPELGASIGRNIRIVFKKYDTEQEKDTRQDYQGRCRPGFGWN